MSQGGMEKSAVLLLALGEEATAAVFRYLSPLEVGRLGSAMREMGVLPRERVQAVLHAFQEEAMQQTGFAADSERFVDEALQRALGPDRAQSMMRRLGGGAAESLKQLAWMEPAEVAALLEAEPPQLTAVVLSHLPHDVAAAVLELLPQSLRGETVLCMAQSDLPTAEALRDLEAWLAGRLNAAGPGQSGNGETAAARVLAGMSRGSAEAVLSAVDRKDAPLAARLRARNLVFEDLPRLPLDSRKTFLRNISARTLLHALKGADERLLNGVSEAMSRPAAQRLRDDLATLGGLPVTDIEAAQDEAAAVLLRLAAEGALAFPEEETA